MSLTRQDKLGVATIVVIWTINLTLLVGTVVIAIHFIRKYW